MAVKTRTTQYLKCIEAILEWANDTVHGGE